MLAQAALLLHAAIETPAAVTFLFFPEKQLSTAAAAGRAVPLETALVLQNLGGLLAASVALSLVLAVWGTPPHLSHSLRGALCLCLAIYHLFPARRAYLRRRHAIGTKGAVGNTLGGPAVHLAVHAACLVLLTSAGIRENPFQIFRIKIADLE
ncbi:hypothetical protein F503_00087 [Ophiostoma piceae UAMH 11346]|uniref:Uncharacterized protein n=1 Tax=Ophiostoma piceae (strain UAMH 11346) TaxID=1262450 RepID=S3CF41_OPHP1|nr:hypothetical protein F503_00087 [Ophiostoma piceae UAMH 11346]